MIRNALQRLSSKIKVTCMSISWFIFWLFFLNIFFLNSLVMATYEHCHPNRFLKWTHKSPKNSHIFLRNVLFEAYFPRLMSLVCQLLVFILTIYCKYLLFQFLRCCIRINLLIIPIHYSGSKITYHQLK